MTQVFNEIQEECVSIQANKERIKNNARKVIKDRVEIDTGVLEVLAKMRKRLEPPKKRRGADSEEAYERAQQKHRLYIERLIKILALVERMYSFASKRRHTDDGMTSISLTRFNIIMSGGTKSRMGSDGMAYIAPLNYNFDLEVKTIIGMFFKQVQRGSSLHGCSQWIPRVKPTLNDSAIRVLTALSDEPKFLKLFDMFVHKIDDVLVLDCAITESGSTEKFTQLLNTVFDSYGE